jgi:GTPase Era involved in 16S rRNA processing
MNEWVTDAPTFAVVGKVNMGKSSVLSTLLEIDDDMLIRVSSTPGETTRCYALPLTFDDKEMIRFVDTPGFSRALEVMRVIQDLHGEGTPDRATIRRFVDEQMENGEFEDEARLLEPVVEGPVCFTSSILRSPCEMLSSLRWKFFAGPERPGWPC